MAEKRSSASMSSQHSIGSIIPRLYSRWTLDLIIDLVLAVSNDFVQRPRHYREIPSGIARILSEFKCMGSAPNLPNGKRRAALYGAIFGRSEFRDGCLELQELALEFSGICEKEKALLRKSFQLRSEPLANYLKSMEGQAVLSVCELTEEIFDKAVSVLKCKQVAGVFGLSPSPDVGWPLTDSSNGDAAHLVSEVARTLAPEMLSLASRAPLNFQTIQQVAFHGAASLTALLSEKSADDKEIDAMISHVFHWRRSFDGLQIDTVKAWTDMSYRNKLLGFERSFIPRHPAGDVELAAGVSNDAVATGANAGVFGAVGQTITSGDDICCSRPTLDVGCDTVTGLGKICCSSGQPCDSHTDTYYCTNLTCDCTVAFR